MLQHLSIKNFALIDQVEIDFYNHLSVITGETGAGKSILLGALGLILGKRADHSSLKDTTKKCVIEGTFNIEAYQLESFFKENDLDYAHHTFLRREINLNGKSRSFINDSPCTLEVMKQLGYQLIDIHSQQQSLQINDADFQLNLIDSLAGTKEILNKYRLTYKDFKKVAKQVQEAELKALENKKQEDYLNFQFTELDDLKLKENEIEDLEEEQKRFSNSEDIIKNLGQLSRLIGEDDENLLNGTSRALQLLDELSRYDSGFESLVSRLKSIRIEMQDIYEEIDRKAIDFEYDPERHQLIEERLTEIHRLQRKHGVSSTEELMALKEQLESNLSSISEDDDKIIQLKETLSKLENDLAKLAAELTGKRQKVLKDFSSKVEARLKDLGIPYSSFMVEHEEQINYGPNGKDHFDFLFSANKGVAPGLVAKTASGGEVSRLVLVMKEILAENQHLPTILFDEIDTGVSGEIAEKIGNILDEMGGNRQVIAITHLPQLAAKGKHHYFVFKDVVNDRSITQIKKLEHSERVEELAKMLSGKKLTEAAVNNARELLTQ